MKKIEIIENSRNPEAPPLINESNIGMDNLDTHAASMPEIEVSKFDIDGMSCVNCAAAIEKSLTCLEDIKGASVNFAIERLTVEHGPAVSPEKIIEIVKNAGFKATHQTEIQTISFKVEGMSCTNCSGTLEKNLLKSDGIQKATVNFAAEKASVEFNSRILDQDDIFNIVKNSGFKAITDHNKKESTIAQKEKFRFLFALLFTIPVFFLMNFSPFEKSSTNYIMFFLASLVQFVSGRTFYEGAWHSLKSRSTNMDVLVSLGISAAYFYSIFQLFFIDSTAHTFFDSSSMIITFIMVGKMLEARAKGKTGEALEHLLSLQADTATIIEDGKETTIKSSRLKKGDLVIIRPGEKVPADGTIIEGTTAVDESMISGEPVPVDKKPGDVVTGATINKTGLIKVSTGSVGNESVLAGIIKLVEDAQADKAPVQRIADRVSNFFVPIVILIALTTFTYWYYFADLSAADTQNTFIFAFRLMISVLVVACPCALGLATPTAIMVGSGVGLKRGILFKKASVLENISKLDIVLFDKTGTLTEGKPEVTGVYPLNGYSEEELLEFSAAVESGSRHPLAEAIVQHTEAAAVSYNRASDIIETGGSGTSATYKNKKIKAGNSGFVCDRDRTPENFEKELADSGNSLVYVSVEGLVAGVIALSDKVKPDSRAAVERLHELHLETALISGDNEISARAVANELGINNVAFNVAPEDKINAVKEWQKKGFRVAMAGDGINDAPALAQADIGIAIGSGTDVAKETGDVVLVNNTLLDVERAIRLGRKTLSTIRQNFFWAFFYNILMIPVAAGIFYSTLGFTLRPEWAGMAMWFSSLTVVLNSLFIKNYSKKIAE